MKIGFLFAGQGAQTVGMGKDIYEQSSIAKDLFDKANEMLGNDIADICFNGPEAELTKTENTQPGIFTVSAALFEILKSKGIDADMYAGFSLGEYSALYAAGMISFEDCVKLVRKRGLYMEEAVPAGKGGMAAILGLENEAVEKICRQAETKGVVSAVNYNCPGQLVISGEMDAVKYACELAEKQGAMRAILLKVSGPFHTTLLTSAGENLYQDLSDITFTFSTDKTVISNATAKPYEKGNEKELLKKQVYTPVYREKSMRFMQENGINTFVEIGPGRTLKGFMRKIDRKTTCYNINDLETLEDTVNKLNELPSAE